MALNTIFLFCEDDLSELVMQKMVKEILGEEAIYTKTLAKRGKGYIKNKINNINSHSILTFFVLIDLDRTECAPTLINEWFIRPIRKNLIFRVAIREIEAWLLADISGISAYLKLSEAFLKNEIGNPDGITDPKLKLISLVDKSNIKDYKIDIVKKEKTSYKQGAGYNTRLNEFVENYWNLPRARTQSRSFEKACKALEILKQTISSH
ncbi:hypothetical protein JW964_25935 [candidate division KSB1 bacterium]|nr:hypothetical protein [candidate division KSB1 bacterium]